MKGGETVKMEQRDLLGDALMKMECDAKDQEESEDLYGSKTIYTAPPRPMMLNPKYRHKEDRRKVLKLSVNKLRRIEDPESSLRRSVLINNTLKRLQREAKEEKKAPPSRCFGITSDFIVGKQSQDDAAVKTVADIFRTSDQLLDVTNLPQKCKLDDEGDLRCSKGRKRSIDEVLQEECEHVLGQFYLPIPEPPPSLMDEDEDVNVVDVDPLYAMKRHKGDGMTAADRLRGTQETSMLTMTSSQWTIEDTFLQSCPNSTPPSSSPYSCGHSSMLNEIVVYHNLIASLES